MLSWHDVYVHDIGNSKKMRFYSRKGFENYIFEVEHYGLAISEVSYYRFF
jgi:hypothetical protein